MKYLRQFRWIFQRNLVKIQWKFNEILHHFVQNLYLADRIESSDISNMGGHYGYPLIIFPCGPGYTHQTYLQFVTNVEAVLFGLSQQRAHNDLTKTVYD